MVVVGFLICVSIGYFIQPTMSRVWHSWRQFLSECVRSDYEVMMQVAQCELDEIKRSIEREIGRITGMS